MTKQNTSSTATSSPNAELPTSILTKSQKKTYGPRAISGYGPGAMITAKVRHDDECGNGHNTFSITAEVVTPASRRRRDIEAGGCLHEEIARVFPELAPFIKWHLVSTDGPMHYVANTVYHASDRDHRGLLKGEKRQLCNGRTGHPVWKLVVRDSDGKPLSVSSSNWVDSEEIPAEVPTCKWEPVWIEGEGKERQLDYARSVAVWPEATDEQLMAPKEELQAALMARLPALMAEFKAAVESLGFTY
jgi:hypothetical protein